MTGLKHITSLLITPALAVAIAAQGRAYAKFDGEGKIIALFNLANIDRCQEVREVTGAIRNLRSQRRQDDVVFSFMLFGSNRRWVLGFSLKSDAMARGDIEDLLSDKGSHRVRVRACNSGDRWIVSEITRQQP